MTYSLLWLPKVLRDAGLEVEEVPGWQTRGHGDVERIVGIICHHIAGVGPAGGPMPKDDLHTVTYGRPDLSGPLCNLALGRDGKFFVVAAGKASHAGRGGPWKGTRDGNAHFIGIEAAQTGWLKGDRAELWAYSEVDAYSRGCAAILDHIGQPYTQCIGHKEWTGPQSNCPGRKTDPTFNMAQFRDAVHFYMESPKGTWAGVLDRMAARLTTPTHQHDGCCDGQVGKVG